MRQVLITINHIAVIEGGSPSSSPHAQNFVHGGIHSGQSVATQRVPQLHPTTIRPLHDGPVHVHVDLVRAELLAALERRLTQRRVQFGSGQNRVRVLGELLGCIPLSTPSRSS